MMNWNDKKIVVFENPEDPYNMVMVFPGFYDETRFNKFPKDTDEALLERTVALVVPDGVNHWVLNFTDVPSDHECTASCEFYNAWRWIDGSVKVDMDKAKVIHMNEIRKARDNELAKLDVPWIKAQESGDIDEQTRIKAEKETLRNLPATFDLTCDTPEELKAKWPEGLPKE